MLTLAERVPLVWVNLNRISEFKLSFSHRVVGRLITSKNHALINDNVETRIGYTPAKFISFSSFTYSKSSMFFLVINDQCVEVWESLSFKVFQLHISQSFLVVNVNVWRSSILILVMIVLSFLITLIIGQPESLSPHQTGECLMVYIS